MPEKRRNQSYAKPVIDKTREIWDASSQKVAEATENTRNVIRENPLKSILIAAAVGAVAGVITSEIIRRSRKRENFLMKKLRRMI